MKWVVMESCVKDETGMSIARVVRVGARYSWFVWFNKTSRSGMANTYKSACQKSERIITEMQNCANT